MLSPRWLVLTPGPMTGLDETGHLSAPIYDLQRRTFDNRTAQLRLP